MKPLRGVGKARDPGAGGPARYLQLHLHQEDGVMVGEDLVYSLFATPLIVFGALSGLWPLASGLWPKEADIRDLLVLLAQAHPIY